MQVQLRDNNQGVLAVETGSGVRRELRRQKKSHPEVAGGHQDIGQYASSQASTLPLKRLGDAVADRSVYKKASDFAAKILFLPKVLIHYR